MSHDHATVTDPKLRAALIRDDELENRGMHADDRETCHPCQTWATQEHISSEQHTRMTSSDMAFVHRWWVAQ